VGAVVEHEVYAPELLASIKACKDTGRSGRGSRPCSWEEEEEDDTGKWGVRPLEPRLLDYAAMDARLIWDLHAALAGRLEGPSLEEVREASKRWV
jgi:hypothetical protein